MKGLFSCLMGNVGSSVFWAWFIILKVKILQPLLIKFWLFYFWSVSRKFASISGAPLRLEYVDHMWMIKWETLKFSVKVQRECEWAIASRKILYFVCELISICVCVCVTQVQSVVMIIMWTAHRICCVNKDLNKNHCSDLYVILFPTLFNSPVSQEH